MVSLKAQMVKGQFHSAHQLDKGDHYQSCHRVNLGLFMVCACEQDHKYACFGTIHSPLINAIVCASEAIKSMALHTLSTSKS